jgi:hypothetical protein
MANAKPSSPGRNIDNATSGMEINIPKEQVVGINEQGITVRRTVMQNGNVREIQVFPGDHPDAKPFPKAKKES